jgi:hypothetical protein
MKRAENLPKRSGDIGGCHRSEGYLGLDDFRCDLDEFFGHWGTPSLSFNWQKGIGHAV